jgi:hypothetical protein
MKLRFLAGIAAGYVLGTRAGREQYDRMVQTLNGSALVQQARGEVAKLRGSDSGAPASAGASGDPGLVAPPVIVGPGPQAATSESLDMAADVVLPDLEPSTSSQDADSAGEPQRAKRIEPPTTP